jgi:hypothetical protein
MRMIAAATLILLPLSASAAPARTEASQTPRAAPAAQPVPCTPFARTERAQGRDGAVLLRPPSRAQRLGELPAGDLSLAVQRQMNGCIEPVIVREGVGAFEAPRAGR